MTGSREHLLCILPSDGHGGCEYNALSALVYFRDRHGIRVTAAFAPTVSTAFLGDLCAVNGLPVVPLDCTFEANDDAARTARQRAATHRLLDEVRPTAVFVPMAWPNRGQGVIAGCADRGAPTAVKFALVPEAQDGFVLPDARTAIDRRQVWFANSRQSAALIERHWALPPRSVDSFHVGPIGLSWLLPEEADAVRQHGPAEDDRRAVREAFGLSADAQVAVTVARLAEQKGHRILLDAADAVLAARPRLHLLFVGEGEERAQIEAWQAGSRFGRRVTLAGFRPDVRRILRGADLFVLPTFYEGGCSQALLEALDEGLPVIASDASAIAEIVSHGENGLLVPPGDPPSLAAAILRLSGDPALCRTLGESARRTAAAYTAERSFEQTLRRIRLASAPHGLVRGRGTVQSPFLPLSGLAGIAIGPEEAGFGAGWHACERDPRGHGFRWMGHAGTVATNIVFDRPAIIELSGYSSLTAEALHTLRLEVDGQALDRVGDQDGPGDGGWACRWRLDTAAERRAVLRFSSKGARRPRDLVPSNQDDRWLSVAIRKIRIEKAG